LSISIASQYAINSTTLGSNELSTLIQTIAQGNPQVIVMITPSNVASQIILAAKQSGLFYRPQDLLFYVVPNTNNQPTDLITLLLGAPNVTNAIQNVYTTEFVPRLFSSSAPIFTSFLRSMNSSLPSAAITAASFEGYLVGRLTTAILQSVSIAGSSLTRDLFLTTLYSAGSFTIGGINIGNYADSGTTCNQGLRTLQLVRINPSLAYNATINYNSLQSVSGGTYTLSSTVCFGVTSNVILPIVFNQIATGLSDPTSPAFKFAVGMRSFFYALNNGGGVAGRNVFMNTYDDYNDPSINQFWVQTSYAQDQAYAIVGFGGYNDSQILNYAMNSTMGMPFIGPFSGSTTIRNGYPNVISFRSSVRDNIASILNLMNAMGKRNIFLVVKSITYGTIWSDGVDAFKQVGPSNFGGLSPKGIMYFSDSTTAQFRNDLVNGCDGADAVIMLCDPTDGYNIIQTTSTRFNGLLYTAPNDLNMNQLIQLLSLVPPLLSQVFNRIYTCQSVPSFNPVSPGGAYQQNYVNLVNSSAFLTQYGLSVSNVNNYLSADGYEGYIVARIITQALADMYQVGSNSLVTSTLSSRRRIQASDVMLSPTNAVTMTRNTFVNNMYSSSGKNLGELNLGTISQPTCTSPTSCSNGCTQVSRIAYMVTPVYNPSSGNYAQGTPDNSVYKFSGCGVSQDPKSINAVAIAVPVSIVGFILIVLLLILLIGICLFVTRKRKIGHAPPTGRMVIAFTDVQNSTILWQQHPVEMKRALKIHNQIIRTLLKKHHGYEVKTQGDSFMVGFNHAHGALSWSMSVQEELLDCTEWPSELILGSYDCRMEWDTNKRVLFKGLRVRIGMHLGNAERIIDPVTNRPDFFGTTVNKAARVESCANGGQVLVSQTLLLSASDVLVNGDTGERANQEKWIQELTETNKSPGNEESNSMNNRSLKSNKSSSSLDTRFFGGLFANGKKKKKKKSKRIRVTQEKIMYRCAGEHTLKGLAGKEVLFEVFVPRLIHRTYDKKVDDDMRELDYDMDVEQPIEMMNDEVNTEERMGLDQKDLVIEVKSVEDVGQADIEMKDIDIANALNAEANKIQDA